MVRKHVIWLNINFFSLAILGAHSSVDVVVRVSYRLEKSENVNSFNYCFLLIHK